MSDLTQLADLLLEWETSKSQGRSVSPAALCRDCPELLEPLRRCIRDLTQLAPVLDLTAHAGDGYHARHGRGEKPAPAGSPGGDGEPRCPPSPPGYEILGEIGRGGMGMVFKARHLALDRLVALKMLLGGAQASPNELARFEAEARAVARLHHPNIVQIYDVGTIEGCPYLVLEYVEGSDLATALAGRSLRPKRAAALMKTVTRAIHHAHLHGIIHRDLKPANILLSNCRRLQSGDLEFGQPKVTDFGLARQLGHTSELTGSGVIIGTPAYMAPEQAAGRRELIGPATDVYALGAVLYQLVTGVPPLEGSSDSHTTEQGPRSEPVLPSKRNPVVPTEIDAICMRCLREDPSERYASAEQLADDLGIYLAGQSAGGSLTEIPVLSADTGGISRRVWLAGAGGVAAAALGFGLAVRWLRRPHGPAIRIGLLHSLTGTMALSERPIAEAEHLAIQELNEAGGLLGRPLEAVVADGCSEDAVFVREAERLISQENVAVIVGCWTSSSRKSVARVVQQFDNLLLYPVQFEGLETSPNVFYFGPAPNQQIVPALDWARETLGKKRFFLIGSDYIFSRAAAAIVKDELHRAGLNEVGEDYLPLGGVAMRTAMRKIRDLQPDLILNFINGDSNVAFFRRLREVGIRPSVTPTLSFSLSEQELLSIGLDIMAGEYVASGYFQSLPGPVNERFVQKLKAQQVEAASDAMATAYGAVHAWAWAVRRARSAAPAAVRLVLAEAELATPAGALRLDAETHYAYRFARIGRSRADGGMDVVYESAEQLKPIPFPPPRTPDEWRGFLSEWHARWGGRWSAPNDQ